MKVAYISVELYPVFEIQEEGGFVCPDGYIDLPQEDIERLKKARIELDEINEIIKKRIGW